MKFKMTPQKLMIALFAIVMLGIPIATIALPDMERSEVENRSLAKFPKLVNQVKLDKAESFSDYIDAVKWDYITVRDKNSFMDDVEVYYSDHLAGREKWVMASNRLEELSGKKEINGVVTVDGQMIQTFKGYDPELVSDSLGAISDFAEKFSDIPMCFMLAPTAQEIYSSKLPSYAGYISQKTFIDDCYKNVNGVTTVDCLSYLSGHKDEYIYYRTDHHWTSLGAYYAYSALAKSLGYSAYGTGSFNIETASCDFRGTLYSKTLDNRVTPDTIDYYHLAGGDPKLTMTVNTGSGIEEYDSLYVREYLDVKDKYSSFTGSNSPVVDIKTNIENGKRLLLIKDSYSHSLVPFLSKHYERITMVDMRYINVGLHNIINMDDYNQVLFAFNVISFSEDTTLTKLSLTK